MIRFNNRILVLLAVTIISAMSVCAKVSFQLVPRQNVVSGTNFPISLRLTVENEDIDNISMPKAPELKGCRLLSGPNATTSQMQQTIINGKSSTYAVIDLVCYYRAGNPGTVRIPSVTLNVGGKAYHSGEGSFEILPPDASSSAQNQGGGMSPGVASSGASAHDFFVRVIFSKSSVYEQEGVIAITKLYRPNDRKFSLQLEAVPKTPVYEGFLSDDLQANPEGQIENYNGKNYITYELARVLLFPQKSGTLKVQSGTYTLRIQEQVGLIRMHGFATPRYEEYTYTTPLVNGVLNVKALPEPRPADFIGAVGDYNLTYKLTPDQLRTNESATYSLTFKGTGNVKYLTTPTVQFPTTFDKYTSKSDIKANVSGQTYTGSYTVDFPIVPQEVGEYEIPAQTFSYFNLNSHKYEQLSVPAIPVKVARGAAVASSAEQKAVDTSMQDILHIHVLQSKPTSYGSPIFLAGWYWCLWCVVVLALLLSIIFYRRHLKLAADVTGRRVARANRVASKRFKAASKFMKTHQDDKFYEELARALKGYIGDKLGMAPSQLISDTISDKLLAKGISAETVDSVLRVLDECEMARFTPTQSDSAMHELYNQASAAIKSIEDSKI